MSSAGSEPEKEKLSETRQRGSFSESVLAELPRATLGARPHSELALSASTGPPPPSKKPRASTSSKAVSSRPRMRCGECAACTRPDCGECYECRRKKKYGGDGSSKKACVFRRCSNLQERPRSTRNADRGSNSSSLTNQPLMASSPPFVAAAVKSLISATPTSASPPPKKRRVVRGLLFDTAASTTSSSWLYGMEQPQKPTKDCCTECQREDVKDDVLLCDGPGCYNEYHLQCCSPPLSAVPEGAFFCVDCDKEGSTATLRRYLEDHDDLRATYEGEDSFIEFLMKREVDSNESETRLPLSELEADGREPGWLVGKPIRLYCPVDNLYHTGRIVGYRPNRLFQDEGVKPKSVETIDAKGADSEAGPTEDGDNVETTEHATEYEYYVRFTAGVDHRKTSLHHWLVLEEHSIAVATRLIWGAFPRKQKPHPGQIWSRTAREVQAVREDLDEEVGQVAYTTDKEGVKQKRKKLPWALGKSMAGEKFRLLFLEDDVIGDVDPPNGQPIKDGECQILYAMALAEQAEQNRIESWWRFELQNPMGPKAIRSLDEYRLEPLIPDDLTWDGHREDGPVELCQLVRQGLDRSYLMSLLDATQSKDVAATLTCNTVPSLSSAIETLTKEQTKMEEAEADTLQ